MRGKLLLHRLLRRLKMHSSYDDWKKKRNQRASSHSGAGRLSSASARVKVDRQEESVGTGDVLSFNQMRRLESDARQRPPSVVGSVRSLQSVLTVEEQVTELERKVDTLLEAQKAAAEREAKTQALLAQIAQQLAEKKEKK